MLQYIGSEASGNLHPRNELQTTTPMLASPTSDPVASHKTPAPHGFRHARGVGSARELEGAARIAARVREDVPGETRWRWPEGTPAEDWER